MAGVTSSSLATIDWLSLEPFLGVIPWRRRHNLIFSLVQTSSERSSPARTTSSWSESSRSSTWTGAARSRWRSSWRRWLASLALTPTPRSSSSSRWRHLAWPVTAEYSYHLTAPWPERQNKRKCKIPIFNIAALQNCYAKNCSKTRWLPFKIATHTTFLLLST